MSQNGPYPGQGWSAGGSPGCDAASPEPADPWGDAATQPSSLPETAWGGQPRSVPPGQEGSAAFDIGYPPDPVNGAPPVWQQPPMPPPRRRNTPIIALV